MGSWIFSSSSYATLQTAALKKTESRWGGPPPSPPPPPPTHPEIYGRSSAFQSTPHPKFYQNRGNELVWLCEVDWGAGRPRADRKEWCVGAAAPQKTKNRTLIQTLNPKPENKKLKSEKKPCKRSPVFLKKKKKQVQVKALRV